MTITETQTETRIPLEINQKQASEILGLLSAMTKILTEHLDNIADDASKDTLINGVNRVGDKLMSVAWILRPVAVPDSVTVNEKDIKQ